jgi:hypothetical protein
VIAPLPPRAPGVDSAELLAPGEASEGVARPVALGVGVMVMVGPGVSSAPVERLGPASVGLVKVGSGEGFVRPLVPMVGVVDVPNPGVVNPPGPRPGVPRPGEPAPGEPKPGVVAPGDANAALYPVENCAVARVVGATNPNATARTTRLRLMAVLLPRSYAPPSADS